MNAPPQIRVWCVDSITTKLPDDMSQRVTVNLSGTREMGNYKPLIVTATHERARIIGRSLSAHFFGKTTIVESALLNRSVAKVEKNLQRIWDRIKAPNRDKYKFAIFVVGS